MTMGEAGHCVNVHMCMHLANIINTRTLTRASCALDASNLLTIDWQISDLRKQNSFFNQCI